jgi:hypothetical protein
MACKKVGPSYETHLSFTEADPFTMRPMLRVFMSVHAKLGEKINVSQRRIQHR